MRLVARARPDLDADAARAGASRRCSSAWTATASTSARRRRPTASDAAELAVDAWRAAERADAPSCDRRSSTAVVDLALGQGSPVDQDAQPTSSSSASSRRAGRPWPRRSRTPPTTATCGSSALNEVGGDPARVGVPADDFHAVRAGPARAVAAAMTTLSTHDTKRAEDVRAALFVLAERPAAWATVGARRRRELAAPVRADELDALTEYFLWQTLVGAWPISEDRLQAYALKAIRESKLYTRWTEPDEAYEAAVERFVAGSRDDAGDRGSRRVAGSSRRARGAGQRARPEARPADDARRARRLPGHRPRRPLPRRPGQPPRGRLRASAGAGSHGSTRGARPGRPARREAARDDAQPCALRRERPRSCFAGEDATYRPRGDDARTRRRLRSRHGDGVEVVTVVTRLAGRLADAGGYGDADRGAARGPLDRRPLPRGPFDGGPRASRPSSVPAGLPVALLVRVGDES